jgi:hypothetical protein
MCSKQGHPNYESRKVTAPVARRPICCVTSYLSCRRLPSRHIFVGPPSNRTTEQGVHR